MKIYDSPSRAKQVVYVQMREYVRDPKTKVLRFTKGKTVTVRDVTLSQVEAVIRKGE